MNPSPEVTWESQSSQKGPRQIHIPKRQLIASLLNAGEIQQTASAVLATPDSRCQIKLSVVQEDPTVDLSGAGITIRLTAVDFDQSGPSGKEIPVTNIEPEDGTFQAFPLTTNLRGFSREFVTAADAVKVELVIPGVGGLGTRLFVQARIQPSGQRLPWDEWREICAECRFSQVDKVVR
jgi:hypothetical protein